MSNLVEIKAEIEGLVQERNRIRDRLVAKQSLLADRMATLKKDYDLDGLTEAKDRLSMLENKESVLMDLIEVRIVALKEKLNGQRTE